MSEHEKLEQIERLLKEIKASKEQSAVTIEELQSMPRAEGMKKARKNPLEWIKNHPFKSVFILFFIVLIIVPMIVIYNIKNASSFTENKATVIERIQNLNELATAEAYTKVIIERQDNTLLGKEIGINFPGTKRQILVVVPGTIKAGVQLGRITEKDITLNEEEKTATLKIPQAEFLGGAEIFFDEIEFFSYEGLLRMKANIEEGYELAEEAKTLILNEAREQGILKTAEENAKKALSEMFSLIGYEVIIQIQE